MFCRTVNAITQDVRGSNYCYLGVVQDQKDKTIIIGALDNLTKGSSGQAIQNANLMLNEKRLWGWRWSLVFHEFVKMKNLKKKRRIQIISIAFVALATATILTGFAMKDGINFFKSPTQVAKIHPTQMRYSGSAGWWRRAVCFEVLVKPFHLMLRMVMKVLVLNLQGSYPIYLKKSGYGCNG